MFTDFVKYWKQNATLGFQRAGKWMGFWGKIVDVIIAMTAGMIYGQDNIILIGIITVVTAFSLYGLFGFIFTLFIVPYQENKKQQNIIDQCVSEQLKLWIDTGGISWISYEPGDYTISLVLNIISQEKQKILDLEAHLLSVDWLTEDQTSVWNHIPFLRTNKLEWEDGKYQTELKPGIDELKHLRVAILNCSNREFMLAHEIRKAFPSHQQNAIYKIEIKFSGRLEGSYDYKSYFTKVDFVSVPIECELGFLPSIANSPKLPKKFKQLLEINESEYE